MVEMPFYDKRVRNAFEEEFIHKLGLSLFLVLRQDHPADCLRASSWRLSRPFRVWQTAVRFRQHHPIILFRG